MTQDEFNQIAWADYLSYAIEQPEIVAQFERETGTTLLIPRSPIEAMVDDVTGAEKAIMEQFVEWVTINHYGLDCAPISYQEAVAKRRSRA